MEIHKSDFVCFICFLLCFFVGQGSPGKPRKPRKAQNSPGRRESTGKAGKPREGKRRPGASSWGSLDLPGAPWASFPPWAFLAPCAP